MAATPATKKEGSVRAGGAPPSLGFDFEDSERMCKIVVEIFVFEVLFKAAWQPVLPPGPP